MKTKHLITIVALVALIGTVIGVGVYVCKEPEDYYKQGLAHLNKRERDLAIADFTKAIEMNPRLAMAYCHRGSLCLRETPDQAISDLSKAIEIDPGLADAYSYRAVTYHHIQEYDKAWDDVHKAESLGVQKLKFWWTEFVQRLRKDSGREK